MSGTATVVLVGGVGLAAFLYFRSQQQQAAALGVSGVGPVVGTPTAATGSTGGSGGISGLGGRLWTQWKGDPLGIQNTKAVIGTAGSVIKTGAKDVGHLATSLVGGIRSIF